MSTSSMYPHTDAYFIGICLMVQSVSIAVFIACTYLASLVFKNHKLGYAYAGLGLIGFISQLMLCSAFLARLDLAPNPNLTFAHWVCIDIFNLGLLSLKIHRLKDIYKVPNRQYYMILGANCLSAFVSAIAFTNNCFISIGPYSLLINNPYRDNIQAALVFVARMFALVIDAPTVIFFKHSLSGLKKFSIKNVQHLDLTFIAITVYTLNIIGIRLVQVNTAPATDRLLVFSTLMFPSTVGIFMAIQFLCVLTSMEYAKVTMQSGSRISKTGQIGSAAAKSGGVKSGSGSEAKQTSTKGVLSRHARGAPSNESGMSASSGKPQKSQTILKIPAKVDESLAH